MAQGRPHPALHSSEREEGAVPDEKKSERIKLVETAPEDVFNDIEALRKVAVLKVTRRVVQVNVSVGRPSDNSYFRIHPDPGMMLDGSVIVSDDRRNDYYYVTPAMLDHRTILPRLRKVTLSVTYSWPGGAIGLWPVPMVEEKTRIACWKTSRKAFEIGQKQWVQLLWNSDLTDYDLAIAEGISAEPTWPTDLDFKKLLKLGFADKVIADPDHPYVLRLRGLAE
jgi:hypothetical protein